MLVNFWVGLYMGPYIRGRGLMYGTDIFMLNFSKLIFVSQDRIEKKSRLGINHCKVDILLFGKGKIKFQIKFILQVCVISFTN